MAKIIVRAHDRDAAVARTRAAIEATVIEGVDTTKDVHRFVLDHPAFRRGGVTTEWLDEVWPPRRPDPDDENSTSPRHNSPSKPAAEALA
jgi:acetyl-CoA carboxylase biotin carboxylase subunit